jgi:predicted transcriptional regulator of viral defense system
MNEFDQRRLSRIQRMRSDSKIAKVLKCVRKAPEAMTSEQVSEQTEIPHAQVRSILSSVSSSNDVYKCEYGHWPILRLDEKQLSQKTNRLLSLYTWNYTYGKP